MNLDNLTSIDQLTEFLSGTQTVLRERMGIADRLPYNSALPTFSRTNSVRVLALWFGARRSRNLPA